MSAAEHAPGPRFTVADLLKEEARVLGLSLLTPEVSLERRIGNYRIQKHGLVFAGFDRYFEAERIQLMGAAEVAYLENLAPRRRLEVIAGLCRLNPVCLIATRACPPPPELLEKCREQGIPLLQSSLSVAAFFDAVNRYFENFINPDTTIHGVLLDIHSTGVLLIGKSGIGKSEVALDLIQRGHRLVADDVVIMRFRPPGAIVGEANAILKFHMEIRGLGIINIEDIFGVTAVRETQQVDLVVELVAWDDYDGSRRLSLDPDNFPVLGVNLPKAVIPVSPGRNLVTIVEVAAHAFRLRRQGRESGAGLLDDLARRLREGE
ncbi:MAG: HPr(Ser) kinase/phosphatase [Deltaproteobacteria bacterium]|nr:HPr(Ser) kinase/phosphatase [Deltaproteobacteria bacterium]